MARYKFHSSGTIIDSLENMWIPPVRGNRHYDEYLKWVADGGLTDPKDPDPPEPIIERKKKAYKKALYDAGIPGRDMLIAMMFDAMVSGDYSKLKALKPAKDAVDAQFK